MASPQRIRPPICSGIAGRQTPPSCSVLCPLVFQTAYSVTPLLATLHQVVSHIRPTATGLGARRLISERSGVYHLSQKRVLTFDLLSNCLDRAVGGEETYKGTTKLISRGRRRRGREKKTAQDQFERKKERKKAYLGSAALV